MKKHHNSFLNTASVIVFFLFAVILCNDARSITLSLPLLGIAILFGYFLADAVSGFVHFLGDTFGGEHTPLIGKTFIFPFREHHRDQLAITRHDFFVTNGHNCLVSLPVMIAMHLFLAPFLATSIISFFFITGLSLVLSVFATNQIHKWAHLKNPPILIKFLQKFHIILNPKHHAIHHTAPYDTYFCITTGWINTLIASVSKKKKRT